MDQRDWRTGVHEPPSYQPDQAVLISKSRHLPGSLRAPSRRTPAAMCVLWHHERRRLPEGYDRQPAILANRLGCSDTREGVFTELDAEVDQVWAEAVVRYRAGEALHFQEMEAQAVEQAERPPAGGTPLKVWSLTTWSAECLKAGWRWTGLQGCLTAPTHPLAMLERLCPESTFAPTKYGNGRWGGASKRKPTDTKAINVIHRCRRGWGRYTRQRWCLWPRKGVDATLARDRPGTEGGFEASLSQRWVNRCVTVLTGHLDSSGDTGSVLSRLCQPSLPAKNRRSIIPNMGSWDSGTDFFPIIVINQVLMVKSR